MEEKEVILTQEGYDKLEKELERLRTETRTEIAERIKVALGFGDLSENSEYDEAKNAQAENEAKIAELENKIRYAKIIDESEIDTKTVQIGNTVTLYDIEFDEEVEYTIVGSTEVNLAENKISNESPIGKAIGLSSTATVHAYLAKLEKQGFIKKEDKKGRTLKVIKGTDGQPLKRESKNFYAQREMVDVPVIGRITAGQPILAVENVTDTFPIPIDFVGNSESFMLTVRGESMIEAGILDGDYILVKKQNNANNGEIVVALIEDEATVKTFYKENGHIRLQPENHTMDPIIVPDCKILGKVAGVFRKM